MIKRINITILVLSTIFLSSCHSFYKIDSSDLREINVNDFVQIEFESGKKLNITNVQHVNITENKELEIIKYNSDEYKIDSVRTLYPLNDIKEIRVKKTDVGKSIFTPIFITIGLVLAFVLSGATWAG